MPQLRGGLGQGRLLADKRTQQAVIMSLIVIGEAVTKVMDGYVEFTQAHGTCRGAACAICAIAWPTAISTSTSMWCGTRYSTTGVAPAIARRASGC
jgi:hypothetical protein